MTSIWPIFFRVAALCLFGIALAGCQEKAQREQRTVEEMEAEDPTRFWLELKGLFSFTYREGQLESEASADKALVDLEYKRLHLHRVTIILYEESRETAQLYGRRGSYFLADHPEDGVYRNDFSLHKYVEVTTPEGTVITTPYVQYSSKEEMIRSGGGHFKKRIQIPDTQDFLICTGEWFEANRSLTKIVDHGDIHVRREKAAQ